MESVATADLRRIQQDPLVKAGAVPRLSVDRYLVLGGDRASPDVLGSRGAGDLHEQLKRSADPVVRDAGQRTRVFVISLPESGDRRRAFQRRASDTTVPWNYFAARTELVSGMSYNEPRAEQLNRPLTRGELGVYASHFALWQQLVNDDADQYIIFEDDVVIDWKLIERLIRADFTHSGVDYLRLYALRPGRIRICEPRYFEDKFLVEFRDRAYGTQAYLITRAGAARFIDCCSNIVRPIDDQLDRYWDHDVPNLGIFPFPVIEQFGASTIESDRARARKWPLAVLAKRKLRWLGDRARRQLWLLARSHKRYRPPLEFAGASAQARVYR